MARIDADLLTPGRQGKARRIPVALLEVLALALQLARALSIPARDAVRAASTLIRASDHRLGRETPGGELPLEPITAHVALAVDLPALRRELDHRLAIAIETGVRPRRGRPRSTGR